MTLYHGSNSEISMPKLMPQTRALDFGSAFYLTSDFEQAAKWARTSVLRRGGGSAIVSVFDFDEAAAAGLRILQFDAPDVAWLRYVTKNRTQQTATEDADYDIVSGPVANDNTMPVLNLYFKGAYSEDEALRRLLPQRLKNQFAMKTCAALAHLKFMEGRSV